MNCTTPLHAALFLSLVAAPLAGCSNPRSIGSQAANEIEEILPEDLPEEPPVEEPEEPEEPAEDPTPAESPFHVLDHMPMNGEAEVPLETQIGVLFDAQVEPQTVGGFTLDGPSGPVTVVRWAEGDIIFMEPTELLAEDTEYTVSATEFILDLDGNSLAQPLSWTFRTMDPTPPQLVQASGALEAGEWRHFGPFEAEGAVLNAAMSGEGDADLYVRRDAQPSTESFDCRPYSGGADENCVLEGEGSWYVSVRGYSEVPAFALSVSWDGQMDIDSHGSLAEGEWDHISVDMEAGEQLQLITSAASDIDLYVRFDAQPTEDEWDQRPYSGSGDEEVIVNADSARTLHIAVHGYAASDYALTIVQN